MTLYQVCRRGADGIVYRYGCFRNRGDAERAVADQLGRMGSEWFVDTVTFE